MHGHRLTWKRMTLRTRLGAPAEGSQTIVRRRRLHLGPNSDPAVAPHVHSETLPRQLAARRVSERVRARRP